MLEALTGQDNIKSRGGLIQVLAWAHSIDCWAWRNIDPKVFAAFEEWTNSPAYFATSYFQNFRILEKSRQMISHLPDEFLLFPMGHLRLS